MNEQGKTFKITERAINNLVEAGYSLKYGARFLKKKIDERVKVPITINWNDGKCFKVDAVKGELVVSWK